MQEEDEDTLTRLGCPVCGTTDPTHHPECPVPDQPEEPRYDLDEDGGEAELTRDMGPRSSPRRHNR